MAFSGATVEWTVCDSHGVRATANNELTFDI